MSDPYSRARTSSAPSVAAKANGIGSVPSSMRSRTVSATSSANPKRTPSILSTPLNFLNRRRTANKPPPRRRLQHDFDPAALGDVIEIGPEQTQPSMTEESSAEQKKEDAELEQYRDAAAHSLGLTTPRRGEADPASVTSAPEESHIEQPQPRMYNLPVTAMSRSVPTLPPAGSPTTQASFAINHNTWEMPPFPARLDDLAPYVQASSTLLKYHPTQSLLAFRGSRQWKHRHALFTIPPNSQGKRSDAPFRAHLHLFKTPEPPPDDREIDRLEINEDSVVFVAENEVAGKRGFLKVGGRDVRVLVDSMTRKGIAVEQNVEELGMTMWLVKMPSTDEMQHWIATIKASVQSQRAERAAMAYPLHLEAQSVRGDLDSLLVSRSGLPALSYTASATPTPSVTASLPNPARSTTPPRSSFIRRLSPPPSSTLTISTLRNMFGAKEKEEKDLQKDTSLRSVSPADEETVPEDIASLGHRAQALLNLFSSQSRQGHHTRQSSLASNHLEENDLDSGGEKVTNGDAIGHRIAQPIANVESLSNTLGLQNGKASDWDAPQVVRNSGLSLPPPPRQRPPPPPPKNWGSTSTTVEAIAGTSSLTLGTHDDHDTRRLTPSPSPHPQHSPASTTSSLPRAQAHPYSKRVSTSSVLSATTSVSSIGQTSFGRSSHRASLLPPPPQRPVPNFAPPPPPSGVSPDRRRSASTTGTSSVAGNRDSLVPRSIRLSHLPPAPSAPPTQGLPPRPDEPGYRHRRSESSDNKSGMSNLYAIPASPSTSHAMPPAAPPPSGPLPPTPDSDAEHVKQVVRLSPPLSRRQRIVSAPTPPVQGIGQPIIPDDMFLHLEDTPTTPSTYLSRPFPPPQTSSIKDDSPPASLSPPPRRNSRTIRSPSLSKGRNIADEKQLNTSVASLTRHTAIDSRDSGIDLENP